MVRKTHQLVHSSYYRKRLKFSINYALRRQENGFYVLNHSVKDYYIRENMMITLDKQLKCFVQNIQTDDDFIL